MSTDLIHIVSFSIAGALLVFLMLEFLSWGVLRYLSAGSASKELGRTSIMNPFFESSDSYTAQDTWREQYNSEIDEIFTTSGQALNKWQPLGLWCAPRYHGKHVNIEKYNIRRTAESANKDNSQIDHRIHFFGGSLVWGWGVRDEKTIPSQLMHLRNDAIIENHAQLGYVSSQSVISFIQRLKYESKPDIVIFLDGLNDIYSANQSGIAGVEQNAVSRKQRFESKNSDGIFEFYRKKSKFINLMSSMFRRNHGSHHDTERDNESLAQAVITAYHQNVSLAHTIATAYNIKAIFIWLPSLFDKPNLTKYERKLLGMLNACEPLYAEIKKIMDTENGLLPQVVNLSQLFSQNKEPIYADPWHYNEHANFLIAEKINEQINKTS